MDDDYPSAEEQKKLFREWEEDYAARQVEDAHEAAALLVAELAARGIRPRLPSPSEIASDRQPARLELVVDRGRNREH